MISCITDAAKGLFNFIYPVACEICQTKIPPESGCAGLCQDCLKQMTLLKPTNPAKHNGVNIWAACVYDGIAKECIHLFKYKERLGLSTLLGRIMSNFVNLYLEPAKFDIITPVPLHRSRLMQRGFNQAELLAKNTARGVGLPFYSNVLKRVKPTLAQAGLSKTKRFANLRGAFKINDGRLVDGRNILLIDDIFTTGSTIGECARALFKAKARSVSALVMARGL